METCYVGLQGPLIFMLGYLVNSDGCGLLQVEEGFGQTVFIVMMQQGRELERAADTDALRWSAGGFTHALQSARLTLGPALCPGQDGLFGAALGWDPFLGRLRW